MVSGIKLEMVKFEPETPTHDPLFKEYSMLLQEESVVQENVALVIVALVFLKLVIFAYCGNFG